MIISQLRLRECISNYFLYLFLSYFKIFLNVPKNKLVILILVSLVSFIALSMENNNANGKSILDIQSGSSIGKL